MAHPRLAGEPNLVTGIIARRTRTQRHLKIQWPGYLKSGLLNGGNIQVRLN